MTTKFYHPPRLMAAFRLAPLPLILATIFGHAEAAEPGFLLTSSNTLTTAVPKGEKNLGPTYVDADLIKGRDSQYLEAEGNVIARNLREQLRADWLRFDQSNDEVEARGNVEITRDDVRIEGRQLKLKMTERIGRFDDIRYFIKNQSMNGRGQANALHFQGTDRYKLEAATYTTCPIGNDDWVLKTKDLDLDYISNIGVARNMHVEYLGTPILYMPWFDFALDERRKSGFLAPSFGASDTRGLEVIAPWYWNIAPNRDATFTPRIMSRRGMQLASEFRYLEPTYQGVLEYEVLPNDQVTSETRYHGRIRHNQKLGPNLTGDLQLENVSDDFYFTDLSSLISETSQSHLPREGSLVYTGDGWSALGRIQTFQTLQNATPLYHRVPQLLVNGSRRYSVQSPLHVDFASEFVRFNHVDPIKATGNRFYAYPSVTMPIESASGFIRPKVGLHYTRYDLDRNPDIDPTTAPLQPGALSLARTLPILSLDSGLYYERDISYGQGADGRKRAMIQTLEPRFYYVKIPRKDQTSFPVFDSGIADLSLGQLFSENQFVGVDRINDANQLTLAATSRFLAAESGIERLQVTLAQRYYFDDQTVSLPGVPARGSDVTDILADVSGQITDKWRLGASVQYNPDSKKMIRANSGLYYRDGPGKLLNLNLRYISDLYTATANDGINQTDFSWQWPIASQWYSVGRVNYSFKDKRLVEGLLGFEYNAGCWSLRSVVQQLATTTSESSTAIFLQLELRGLTKLGPSPLSVLKDSISGYGKSDEIDSLP